MKTQVRAIAVVAFSLSFGTAAVAQRYDDKRTDNRQQQQRADERIDRRDSRIDDRELELRERERAIREREQELRRTDRQSSRDSRRNDDSDELIDSRRDLRNRQLSDRRYDNEYREREDRNSSRLYDRQDLSRAYDEGYDDGLKAFGKQEKEERRENYKNFTVGLYGGANSTRFEGEALDANGNATGLAGRLGYQLGFFVRGGGRFYGQIGAEYLTSSSEFYRTGTGDTTSVRGIISNVDQQYLHIPAYVGVKLAQSERGVSGIRLQVGAEFATPLGGRNTVLNIERSDFNDATLNGLANIGFDAGPLFIDFVYHHGFQNVLRDNTSNSQRRILAVNVGVKF